MQQVNNQLWKLPYLDSYRLHGVMFSFSLTLNIYDFEDRAADLSFHPTVSMLLSLSLVCTCAHIKTSSEIWFHVSARKLGKSGFLVFSTSITETHLHDV